MGLLRRCNDWLSHWEDSIPIGPIVYFRIVLGLAVLAWSIEVIAKGGVNLFYVDPVYHFKYHGFGWVAAWPGEAMHWHFYVLAAAALGMVLGFAYRVSALVVAAGFTHAFLVDKALYQNHYYLMCLLAWIAVVLPAHRALSVDCLLRPSLRSSTAPAWTLWLLRFQIAIPYVYGGIAKLEADWLRGQPMRASLAARTDVPIVGSFLDQEWFLWFIVYGGLLFDLLIVPALLWSRTRPVAFVLAAMFHLTNASLFPIGVFPWLMALATVLFFPPEILQRLLRLRPRVEIPDPPPSSSGEGLGEGENRWRSSILGALLLAYVGVQLVFPLRHLVYPGSANWTEQGHGFSWHMMLRGKRSGVRLYATDPKTGRTGTIDLRAYLSDHQTARFGRDPAMIHQLCQYIAKDLAQRGYPNVELRAFALSSLNGRKPQLLIDPEVDLAAVDAPGIGCDWIMPLTEPLRDEAWDVPLEEWERHVPIPDAISKRIAANK
ncbi:MAG: HTTM domain-containing protein [Pirellulales bacterium]